MGQDQKTLHDPLFVKRLLKWLTEPAAALVDPEKRRRARLLSALLLVSIPLAAFGALLRRSPSPEVIGGLLLLALAYLLSRTRYAAAARGLTLIALSAIPFVSLILLDTYQPFDVLVRAIWMATPILVGGLLLSPGHAAVIAGVNFGAVILATLFSPILNLEYLVIPLLFIAVTSALVIMIATVRQRDLARIARQSTRLVDSESRFRQLVEHSPEPICVHRDGKWIYINPAAVRMFGAETEQDLIGSLVMDRVHPDYRDVVEERIKQTIEHGKVVHMIEEKMMRLDGTVIDVEVAALPITYQGQPATQVLIRDITERKRAEREMEQRNLLLETLSELSRSVANTLELQAIMETVAELVGRALNVTSTRIHDWDREARQTTVIAEYSVPQATESESRSVVGSSRQLHTEPDSGIRWLQTPDPVVIHVDNPALDTSERERYSSHGIKSVLFVPLIAQGTPIGHMELRESRHRRAFTDHEIELATAMARQVAMSIHNARLHQQVQESEERFRSVTEDALAGVYITQDLTFTYVNPALARLFGYTPEELIGDKSVLDLTYPADRDLVRERIEARLSGELETVGYTFRGLTKSREIIHCEVLGRRVDYDGKPTIIGTLIDITERIRAEEEYHRLAELHASLIKNMTEVIVMQDRDGVVTFVNHAVESMLGYRPQEVVGHHWKYFTPDKYHDVVRAADSRREDGIAERYEIELIRKDGSHVPVFVSGTPRFEDGEFVGTLAVFTDITQIKQAESEFRRLKEFNEDIVQSVGEGIVLQRMDGTFEWVNPAAADLLGYTVDEMIDMHWTEIIPEDNHPIVHAADKRRKQRQSDQYELDLIDRAGERLPTLVSGSPRIKDGELIGMIAVFTDITKQKIAQEALRASEQKYRTIIESIEDGYFEVDLEGNLVFFNDALVHISGYPPNELMGLNYARYTTPATAHHMERTFQRVGQTGESIRDVEWEIVRRNGTQSYIEASVTPIVEGKDKRVTGFRGIARDITERKMAEEALHAAYEALQEVDKMKDEMIQNISHEFRTPLTYVISYVDLLLDDSQGLGRLTDMQRNSLRVVAEQARRLQWLVENFFTAQRLEERAMQRELTNVRDLLNSAVDNAWLVAQNASIELGVDVPENLPQVYIDTDAVRQVVDNLLSNAIKFTPDEGQITLRAWYDKKLYVSVMDTGVGIPPEALEHVFDRFFQADGTSRRRYGGLGLGLAICKQVIEAHGETIWVDSSLNKGTTFTFTLPLN